jgi:hypothetical protein
VPSSAAPRWSGQPGTVGYDALADVAGWVAAGLRYRCRVGDAKSAEGARGTGCHERAVPHLAEDELLAWRGMLELEARVLAVLDAELREKRGMSISEFDALYQLWIQPGGRCRMKDLASRLLVAYPLGYSLSRKQIQPTC